MFETSKHVPKTEKRCCVFKDNLPLYCLFLLCTSRKYTNSPCRRVWNFLVGGGSIRLNILKFWGLNEMHEALWKFPEGGGSWKNPSVGMDGYFLQLHFAKKVNKL